MKIELKGHPVLRDLGANLLLTCASREDAAAVAEFNARIHSDDGMDQPDEAVAAWTRDLLERPHPTFKPEDTTLVVEASTGRIASCMNIIHQTWAYAGIPFGLGRPELVGTLPEFRNRGLVRAQFELIHQWSAERGELVQAITGIPYYYRLFGYEMCVELGGNRVGYEAQLPKLKEGESEAFAFRPAAEADLPFIMQVYAHACSRKLLTCVRDEAHWRYSLFGQSARNVERLEYRIITRIATGERLGVLAHPWYAHATGLVARFYELIPGANWLEVTPAVLRYLWQTGGTCTRHDGKPVQRTSFGFRSGSEHPVYEICRQRLVNTSAPYAFFMRVSDLAAFLQLITPVLEQRLASSLLAGFTGTCQMGFYRRGLNLNFQAGLLASIEPWQPGGHEYGRSAFPDLVFLQLLFGYRSLEELHQSFVDCYYSDEETRLLLEILFPKRASDVLYID